VRACESGVECVCNFFFFFWLLSSVTTIYYNNNITTRRRGYFKNNNNNNNYGNIPSATAHLPVFYTHIILTRMRYRRTPYNDAIRNNDDDNDNNNIVLCEDINQFILCE